MKHTALLLFIISLSPVLASAQTPTFVQHVSCPNGQVGTGNNQSNTPDYKCPLPEPAQAGNTVVVGVVANDQGTFNAGSVTDDGGNTYTLANSRVDGNGAFVAIYVAQNVAAGTRMIDFHRTNPGAWAAAISASEYYNVTGVGISSCASASGTSISSGSITPAQGSLVWQWATNTGGGQATPIAVSSFTAGNQTGMSWELNGTDLWGGSAVQASIYNTTGAVNPTFSSGSSASWTSCSVELKAGAAGRAPTNSFRVVHMLHQQMPKNAANPYHVQFPTSGNLIINSYVGGGSAITSMSSTPTNTWSSTGPEAGNETITAGSQIYYAGSASTSGSMTISITRADTNSDGTFMFYDVVGAATSPFDRDSGGQTGNQSSIVTSFTTCSGCLTPGAANELLIANAPWNFCTGLSMNAPSGSLFDAATDTDNGVDGPEYVDQNNGWMHFYDPNTNPVTVTWHMACGSTAESEWSGRVAAFKPDTSISQQPAPPTQLNVVVN